MKLHLSGAMSGVLGRHPESCTLVADELRALGVRKEEKRGPRDLSNGDAPRPKGNPLLSLEGSGQEGGEARAPP